MKFSKYIIRKALLIVERMRKTLPNVPYRKLWSMALKDVFNFIRALKRGLITFCKMDGTVTTRNILPIDGNSFGTPSTDPRFFCIDADKKVKGERAIISFYWWQVA